MNDRNEPEVGATTIRVQSGPTLDLSRVGSRQASLLVVQGADIDVGTHVVCDRPIMMGRDADVELPLLDGLISRHHCRVERDATGEYLLHDLGSTNGTRVNGVRVVQVARLAEGDKIFLGTSVVRFSFADKVDVDFLERVDRLVATDDLTGLMSRRRFEAVFPVALREAKVGRLPLAVLVVDMDGLKRINDTHGHDVGGHAIVELAGILRAVLGGRGAVCRFGGDEFVAVLPRLDRGAAFTLAEQVRETVAGHRFEKDGVRVAPTVSIGVAAYPADGDSTETLFRAADQALYRAKAAGRNRVML